MLKHLFIAAFSCAFVQSQAQAPTGKDKPNIVFLLADDLRWDAMGAMGNSIIQTPNLDRMAGEGLLFRNAYVTTSICVVSRASILRSEEHTSELKSIMSNSYAVFCLNKKYQILQCTHFRRDL